MTVLLTTNDQLHLFADHRFHSMETIVANFLEFRAVLPEATIKSATDEL